MPVRAMSTDEEILNAPREAMEYDVAIVGAGPAGLSAAIRFRQLCIEHDLELSCCVLEKGHDVGAHILSGNVFEPRALDELIPDWKEKGAPLKTAAGEDKFFWFPSESAAVPTPVPPMLHNEGNYVISLGELTRWMRDQAEELGVEVWPGTPVSEVVTDESGAVVGVATADMGIDKTGKPKDTFMRGTEIRAKQTILAEGCRGSTSEAVMKQFGLREGKEPQIYGLGLKEVWRVDPAKCKPGYIQHSVGWPLSQDVYGGTFLYHMEPDLVLIGMVVGLDYKNPYLSPYQEFQRWKHHPKVARFLEGGECIQYGARCINEGGFQAIPKLTFPGGMLAGCSAGFVNVPKIKGSHTAMKTGALAGEAAFRSVFKPAADKAGGALESCSEEVASGMEVTDYQTAVEQSWVWDEMKSVRNYHPSFKYGLYGGLVYSAVSAFVTKGSEPWTFTGHGRDADATEPADKHSKIEYPKPDGKLSFDLLTNLARTGVYHESDQPAHLRIKPDLKDTPKKSWSVYAAPETRFCPARVYEYPEDDGELVINAQNCIHCKCCSIKMPDEYINWTVPESGGGGPSYEAM